MRSRFWVYWTILFVIWMGLTYVAFTMPLALLGYDTGPVVFLCGIMGIFLLYAAVTEFKLASMRRQLDEELSNLNNMRHTAGPPRRSHRGVPLGRPTHGPGASKGSDWETDQKVLQLTTSLNGVNNRGHIVLLGEVVRD